MSKQPDKIKHQGNIYVRADLANVRVAQLQQLLQQYETESGKLLQAIGGLDTAGIKSTLENAHKSLMGKQAEPAIKALTEVKGGVDTLSAKLGELIEVANTVAGHLGMGGH